MVSVVRLRIWDVSASVLVDVLERKLGGKKRREKGKEMFMTEEALAERTTACPMMRTEMSAAGVGGRHICIVLKSSQGCIHIIKAALDSNMMSMGYYAF